MSTTTVEGKFSFPIEPETPVDFLDPERIIEELQKSEYLCVDCHRHTIFEYYMVHHYLWQQYGAEDKMLCISCLEHRMQRQLTPEDFLDCYINSLSSWAEHPKSAKLLDRLLGISSLPFSHLLYT